MPVVQIDWQSIKAKLGDVTAIYAFTHRQASLLLSLAEQLDYKKTFNAFGYDFSDKDDLDWEVDDIRNNLMSPVNLVDLLGYIDEVEQLLRNLDQHAACCDAYDPSDGQIVTNPVEDGVGTVPAEIVAAGYATNPNDWAGFDDYKCMISHLLVEQIHHKLNTIAPLVDSAGAIVGGLAALLGIVGALLTGVGTYLVIGVIGSAAAAASLFEGLTSGSFLESLADDVEANAEDLACALYNADGPEAGIAALYAKAAELFTGPEVFIIQNLWLLADFRAFYGGRYDQENIAQKLADQGYDVGSYVCDCIPWVGEYQFEFNSGLEEWSTNGWFLAGGGHEGNCVRTGGLGEYMRINVGDLRVLAGETYAGTINISRVEYWGWTLGSTDALRISIWHEGTGVNQFEPFLSPSETWLNFGHDVDEDLTQGVGDWAIELKRNSGIGQMDQVKVFYTIL